MLNGRELDHGKSGRNSTTLHLKEPKIIEYTCLLYWQPVLFILLQLRWRMSVIIPGGSLCRDCYGCLILRDCATPKTKQHPQSGNTSSKPTIRSTQKGSRSLTWRRWTLKENVRRPSISDASSQPQMEMGVMNFPRFSIICCHVTNSRVVTRLSVHC